MAFVSSAAFGQVSASKSAAFSVKKSVAVSRKRSSLQMVEKVVPPKSEVLGLGKEVPSALYAIASVFALGLGCWSVTQSNLFSPLTAQSVNPQFVVGSLLVPISWGLHVAAWIQKYNGK
eukprot:CAMPEP_0184694896 /NCGR_PEP_ID=MMETSP0313-20130426/2708_1 /TAXON_ID=2792 /ORGANISM="Porphyridium aerugineum, Strain SAG 1380-2" /LENGTH=118 /DNA_ID=CAMNT_0027153261 /DNA_START=150 /DNA_END=506 /DNA_ORIENTATION=-